MGRIPDDTIREVRDRVDLVDLIGRHLSLRQSGRSFKGLCPFHDEKTPSFQVNRERQSYYCFGCGVHGDCFRFLMERENLSFPEALRALAGEVGVTVPETGGGEPGITEQLVQANAAAQAFYTESLRGSSGAAARAYLEGRGIDAATIEQFGIGFAPDGWDGVRKALGAARISEQHGHTAGLLAERKSGGYYDLLRARVIFPIQDVRGRVVGFGGRATGPDQEPKYLNTPETPLFHKRESFYGFPQALEPIRKSGRAVICEGYFDCIALVRAGVGESVATCGTALTEGHARQIRRRTGHVVLLFDGDAAGHKAVERALEVLLPAGLRVSAAALPPGEDPDDVLQREGAEALRKRVDDAPPALQLVIRRAVSAGCRTPWEKADAVNAVAPFLARVTDRVERHEFARQLALMADTELPNVLAALRAGGRGGSGEEVLAPATPRREPVEERHLRRTAQLLLEHPGEASALPPEQFLALIEGSVWAELIAGLLQIGAAHPDGIPVSALAETLGEVAHAQLYELAAAAESPCEPEDARRVLLDTLQWFRRRQQKSERVASTRRLRGEAGDAEQLITEKTRQIAERRALSDTPDSRNP